MAVRRPTDEDLKLLLSLLTTALSVVDAHWDDLSEAHRRELLRAAKKRAASLLESLASPMPGDATEPSPKPQSRSPLSVIAATALAHREHPASWLELQLPAQIRVSLPDELLQALLTALLRNFSDFGDRRLHLQAEAIDDGARRVRITLRGSSNCGRRGLEFGLLNGSLPRHDKTAGSVATGRALRRLLAHRFDVTLDVQGQRQNGEPLVITVEVPAARNSLDGRLSPQWSD